MTIYLVYSTVALSETGRSIVEVLVGESIFLYVWCGNGVPNFWTIGQKFRFLDKSSAQHEIRCFLSTSILAVSNDLFSTCCVVFLKSRCRDIVVFNTKIEWMRIWSLTHSKLHVSPCDVVNILSDHLQCPCDAINTFQGKVPA